MQELNEKELSFVARFFRRGLFDRDLFSYILITVDDFCFLILPRIFSLLNH